MCVSSLEAPHAPRGARPGRSFFWIVAALFAAAAAFNGVAGGLNPDVSWLLLVGERLLDGEALYRDVWESNPPFSVLLYWPMAALEALTGLRAELWTSLFLFGFAGFCVWLSTLVLRISDTAPAFARRMIALAALTAGLFLLPRQFAEREHFGAFAALPLLALYAARGAWPQWKPALGLAVAIGALGATLLIIKPQYALGYAFPALWMIARRRDFRLLFVPEHIAGAAVVGLYAVSVFIFFPRYIADVLPVMADLYVGRRLPLGGLLSLAVFIVLPVSLLVLYLRAKTERADDPGMVWLLAGLGFFIGYLLNGKGWLYHLFPALLPLFIGLAFALIDYLESRGAARAGVALAAGIVCLVGVQAIDRMRAGPYPTLPAPVRERVHPRLAVFSADIAVGNPRARMMAADWRERDNGEMIAALALRRLSGGETANPEHYEALIAEAVDRKAAYFAAAPVDVVLIDHRNPALLERFRSDPRIAEALSDFETAGRNGEIEYLVRRP